MTILQTLGYRRSMPERPTATAPESFSIPDVVPIFPLPNVVLFPKTFVPLYIFEHRYRAMVADTLQQGHCIGMAVLKDGWEKDYRSAPPFFELGCVGRLAATTELANGRYNILLEGLDRCLFEEQSTSMPYRCARVTHSPIPSSPPLDSQLRSHLVHIAESYLRMRNAHELCRMIIDQPLTDEALVNGLSACLDFTSLEKFFLLESEHLRQQARRLLDLIEFKIGSVSKPTVGNNG